MKVLTRKRQSQDGSTQAADVGLMLRVQRDEPGAFSELIDQYWPKVFGRFFRIFANRQDAEDLAQEVFLRLYRARKRYQPQARFNTWLYHIAHNVARNAMRSRKRKPILGMNDPEESCDSQHTSRIVTGTKMECPSQPLERDEVVGVVRAAVSDLAERQRTAVELHQFQHHTYAQVAQRMDMTPKAAKSLLYRARNQLRENLSKYMES